MSTINQKTIEELMAPTRMSLDWLQKVTWNLHADGHFWTCWHGGPWLLTIEHGKGWSTRAGHYDVTISHRESGDILSRRVQQSQDDIIQLTIDTTS